MIQGHTYIYEIINNRRVRKSGLMISEKFNLRITLEQSKFNDLHKCHALQNKVIDRNSQLDVLIVRMSTIRRMLIVPTRSGLSFKNLNNDTHSSKKMEDVIKERRQVKNMFLELINNRNLEINSIYDDELQEVDEELLWLMQEYYRLSSLPSLTDNDTKRMLLILELAQIDPQLDNFINEIDAAIAEEVGLTETNSSSGISSHNSSTKKTKEIFIKYLERRLSNLEEC